jgi:hypothetical protein
MEKDIEEPNNKICSEEFFHKSDSQKYSSQSDTQTSNSLSDTKMFNSETNIKESSQKRDTKKSTKQSSYVFNHPSIILLDGNIISQPLFSEFFITSVQLNFPKFMHINLLQQYLQLIFTNPNLTDYKPGSTFSYTRNQKKTYYEQINKKHQLIESANDLINLYQEFCLQLYPR